MEAPSMLNVGFGNRVVASRVVSFLLPGSSPVRRLKEEAQHAGRLANATHGRKCRSLVLLDSGQIVLSAVQAETLSRRFRTVCSGIDGHAHQVVGSRVVGVLVHGSSATHRLKRRAREEGKLVDLTHGKKCRSLLLLDSGHVVLSSVHGDTLSKRLEPLLGELPE